MKRWMSGAAPVLAVLFAACSLPEDGAQTSGPQNTCNDDGDCAGAGRCVQSRCVATEYALDGLLIEVRPRSDAAYGANTSFLFHPEQAGVRLVSSSKDHKAMVARLDPKLPSLIAIRGAIVQLDQKTAAESGCTLDPERSIPAVVSFYRQAPYAGLPFERVTTTTNAERRIDIDLVPDTYDIYVEPLADPACNGGKPLPPAILPGTTILTGSAQAWVLPAIGKLSGTLSGLGKDLLAGWTVDLLEPGRGLPVATGGALTLDPVTGVYTLSGDFTWLDKGTPILRISPPESTILPTMYWDAVVAKADGKTSLEFTIAQGLPELLTGAVETSATVVDTDGVWQIPATVTIQSKEVLGANGGNASFAVANVATDAQAKLGMLLPPGTYDLRLTPIDNGLAITDREFGPIKAGTPCFCGQRLNLDKKISLGAAVQIPTGHRVAGATVSFGPSQTEARDFWKITHSLPPIAPRSASSQTSSDGNFTLLVDSGTGDLVIQTDPGSGYPWFVRPRVEPQKIEQEEGGAMGALVISYPALLGGFATDPSGAPIEGAEVNAWFAVRDPSKGSGRAGTVIKIATTSTGSDGGYTLLLPAKL